MAYTTINKSTDYFNTKLYTGNGGTNAITGVGFQPDMVWIKDRTGTNNHEITDAVRDVNYQIYPNLTNAQTNASNHLTTFGTDGFTVGSDGSTNTNSSNYVSWNWKAGTTGSGNTTGSGTYKAYSYSVNTTAGFSIVKYKGNGTNGHQIPHHLGVSPNMIIIKKTSSTEDWIVQNSVSGWDKRLILNTTNTEASHTDFISGVSTTTFTLQTNGSVNTNDGDYIAYCFAEKTGYSKMGSYTGNGNADGTFIYTGMSVKYVLLKRTDSADGWWIIDDKQANPYPNPNVQLLIANTDSADNTSVSPFIDIYSNGFKLRSNWGGANASGGTYIYMAFGQSLVGSNNVPNTAR